MTSTDRLSYLNPTEIDYGASDNTFNPCKNLNEIFSSEEDAIDTENLRVYLRVRPSLPDENHESEEFQVDILDKNSIVLTAPASSNTFKNSTHEISKLCQKFTFSHIYGTSTTQKELFEESTQGLVNDFISGQNILLFTYGATNSGKTFTVQGTPTDPGILPRTLEVIFKSVGERHYPNNDLKPRYHCGVSRLEEKDIKKEEERKQSIFRTALENGSRFSLSTSTLSKFSSDFSLNDSQPSSANTTAVSSVIEVTSHEGTSPEMEDAENTVYAVFVSFVEIYNEYIYDLLEPIPLSRKSNRKPLMLGEDRNASIYIKGLQEVRVSGAEEALQLLEIGRENLHFAATRLNHNSSRSHCIFTMKLVKLADSSSPHVARVSVMSICDLAGTERAGKTKGSHDRLKEAGNINTSLLVLSRCMDALRQNQSQKGSKKREMPVPYRESKLTRLFQSFFLGRGKAAMIVNISRSPLMFDETLQVLKFSSIAKQVAISHAKQRECSLAVPKRRSPFTKFVRHSLNSSGRLSVPWMKDANMTFGESDGKVEDSVILEEDEEEEEDERYEALLKVIAGLRDKLLQEHREKVELEDKLRNELCTEFSQQLVEIENSWSQRLKEQQARTEEFSEWRINALMKSVKKTNGRKRFRPEDDPDEEYVPSITLFQEQQKVKEQSILIEELEAEKKHLNEELVALRIAQKKTSEKANKALEENTKITFQLAQLTQSLDEAQKMLETQKSSSDKLENKDVEELETRDREIKALKGMLVEAVEEFIIQEEKIQNLTKDLELKDSENTNQLMTLNELENQLSQAQEVMSQHATQLEEREQYISELQEQLSIVQNVEDMAGEVKKLRTIAESYQAQVLILEQNLTTTEKERNKAEKELYEVKVKKRQIEEDFLRDKSKLLLELAALKRGCNQNGVIKSEPDTDLQDALAKIAQLEHEVDMLKQENGHLNNQVTETKELFEHVKTANFQLESHQTVLLKEKEELRRDLEELTEKLASVQDERATEQLDTSALKASNVNITNQVNTMKNQIQDNEELIATLNEQLVKQQVLLEEVTTQKENLEKVKEELMQKVKSLQESLDTLTCNEESGKEELVKRCDRLKEELADMKTENESLKLYEQKCTSLQEKLDEFEAKLAQMVENLDLKEQELVDQGKESEELISKLKIQKESAVQELNEEVELKNEVISKLESEVSNLKEELKIIQDSLEKKKEEELCLLDSLQQREAELEERKSSLSEKKSLEDEMKMLRTASETENLELSSNLEKLKSDLQGEIKLREDTENLLTSKSSELQDMICEKTKLEEDLISSQKLQSDLQGEIAEKMREFMKEKEDFTCKLSNYELVISAMKEEKAALKELLEKTEHQWKESKDSSEQLKAQVTDYKEKELQAARIKSSYQEELHTVKTNLETLTKENVILEEKFKNTILQHKDLHHKLKEKEEVVSSLSAKVESLDRKLNKAEDEYEEKKRNLEEELIVAKNKCDLLEREIRAVREARQEETSLYTSQVHDQEEQIRQKDTEVFSLQQELKKLLQQSMSSSICSLSQSTTSDTPGIKRETSESNKEISTLKEELRQKEISHDSLLQEVTDLRGQLEKLSLSHLSKKSPTKSSQKKNHQLGQSDCVASDAESVSVITPIPKSRSTRKTRTPALTPLVNDSVQLDTTSEDFAPQIKIRSSCNNGKTASSRPQRSSRRTKKLEDSFEVYNGKSDLYDIECDEGDVWEPPVVEKKPPRGGGASRKPRGRKTKSSQVFNPHLNNQENKSILANQSPDVESEDFKTPNQRRKRHLFKSTNDELFTASPGLIDLPSVEESPHSVVRRQLRSKRK